ncbi:MAG: N-acetyltransferase [Bacteroidetes bacterium 4572_77]|nr:MAG: N-acetyltransferase [Bacteroidetes bacterium 4572_77]
MEPFSALRDYTENTSSEELEAFIKATGSFIIRFGTVLYPDIEIGDGFETGNNAVIRSNTRIGDNVLVGTCAVIEGDCVIGNDVKLQTGVYVTRNCVIEDGAFLGPRVVTTNDKNMLYGNGDPLKGAIIKKDARIGANSTILPGITIGIGSVVGAGSVVTKDVPDGMTVVGNPSKIIIQK